MSLQLGDWAKDMDTDRVGIAGTVSDIEELTGPGDSVTVDGSVVSDHVVAGTTGVVGVMVQGVQGTAGVVEVMGQGVQGTAGAIEVIGHGDAAGIGTGTDLPSQGGQVVMNMAPKDILVTADNSQACASRRETACKLALSHGADVTGLFVDPGTMLPKIVAASAGPELIEDPKDSLRSRTFQTETVFKQTSDHANLDAEWRDAERDSAQAINHHDRRVDPVIMSQGDGDEPSPISEGLAVMRTAAEVDAADALE